MCVSSVSGRLAGEGVDGGDSFAQPLASAALSRVASGRSAHRATAGCVSAMWCFAATGFISAFATSASASSAAIKYIVRL